MYTPLLILCVLSVIGSACGIYYGFGLAGIASMTRSDIESTLASVGFGADSQMIDHMLALAELGPWFVVFNIVEIVGVVLVLRGLWAGFHVYTVSQIGLAGIMVIAMGFSVSLMSILWNAAWVMLYLNLMRRAGIAPGSDGEGNKPTTNV